MYTRQNQYKTCVDLSHFFIHDKKFVNDHPDGMLGIRRGQSWNESRLLLVEEIIAASKNGNQIEAKSFFFFHSTSNIIHMVP